MRGELQDAAAFLRSADYIHILSHQYPDGDTIGSAAALCLALRKMGKHADMMCNDPFSSRYGYMLAGLEPEGFEPQAVVAVDIADPQLLGSKMMHYADRVDWCIDHHPSNTGYAKVTYVRPEAAATTEIICELVEMLGVEIGSQIADCIYTGITTDTGCFRYTNATAHTYRVAARMMEYGARAAEINRIMFDTKSRARLEIERRVLDTITFYYGGRVAVVYVTQAMKKEAGAHSSDMEGLAAMPRQVEGVSVGITMREKEDGTFKISMRTNTHINASKICAKFGGGGHAAAAGCVLEGPVEAARRKLVDALKPVFGGQA